VPAVGTVIDLGVPEYPGLASERLHGERWKGDQKGSSEGERERTDHGGPGGSFREV
jgi:hypothetical protein